MKEIVALKRHHTSSIQRDFNKVKMTKRATYPIEAARAPLVTGSIYSRERVAFIYSSYYLSTFQHQLKYKSVHQLFSISPLKLNLLVDIDGSLSPALLIPLQSRNMMNNLHNEMKRKRKCVIRSDTGE